MPRSEPSTTARQLLEVLRAPERMVEFALADWDGNRIDWRPDFPAAETRVLPGRHGLYFSGEPLEFGIEDAPVATTDVTIDARPSRKQSKRSYG